MNELDAFKLKLYTINKPLDGKITDTIVKAFPSAHVTVDFALCLYGLALRRKNAKLPVTVKYIKQLYKNLLKEVK